MFFLSFYSHNLRLFLAAALILNASQTFLQPSFPGAEGFGATASGGRGGKVIYVTNLHTSGPGSLTDALNQTGPRYILFKVSGVIPGTISVPQGRGDFTIAGQTAPGGITVRGFEMYNDSKPSVSNIVIRHLRSRIGDRTLFPTPHWTAEDGITIGGVHNAIIDHCSFAHAIDEAVDISRSSRLTMQHCMLAETLGDHAYLGGMLINYSDSQSRLDSITIHHNVWNRIGGRMPEISCETPYCNGKTIQIELSNNLFWDPQIELWYEGITGFNGAFHVQMNAVRNLSIARPSYGNAMFHHDLLDFSQNRLFFEGNKLNLYPQLKDYALFYCCNDFPDGYPNTDLGKAFRAPIRFPYPTLSLHTLEELPYILASGVGAFPRDAMDNRLTGYILQNSILQTPVSAPGDNDAFKLNQPTSFPEDSDNDGMPDYWEAIKGTNPSVQDHNGYQLSQEITGVTGYTNLECYLNCLSDALVSGSTTMACAIQGFQTFVEPSGDTMDKMSIFPNPADQYFTIESNRNLPIEKVEIFNLQGICLALFQFVNNKQPLDIAYLHKGLYIVRVFTNGNQFPQVLLLQK
jgi:pectate lyase